MIQKFVEDYLNEVEIKIDKLKALLDDDSKRIELLRYLKDNPNREFSIKFLKSIMKSRFDGDFEIGNVENLMLASYLLGLHKDIQDSLLIWDAKKTDFDSYCGLDVQLVVFCGVKETIEFLNKNDTDKALEAKDYLIKCQNAGDFDEIEDYFSSENLPWWL